MRPSRRVQVDSHSCGRMAGPRVARLSGVGSRRQRPCDAGCRAAAGEGDMTTMKTGGAGRRRSGAGTVEQLSRADRVARGKDARAAAPLESHARVRARRGRGIRSGCCWGRRRRGCRSWCRSGTGGCWSRRSRSTGARRCRWRPTWPRRPTSGLRVQLCGDAHLSNFGAFASPERRLVFDVNDFDETLPGPVRVGRQAAGGEPGRGRAGQRVRRQGPPQDRPGGGRGLPDGDARVRGAALPGRLVRAPGRRGGHRRVPVAAEGEEAQGAPRRCWPRRTPATACRRWAS